MKRILMIAPSSYPVNGAEAIVNIKLLQTLSLSGEFEIDLISKKNRWANYPSASIASYGIKLHSLTIVEVCNRITVATVLEHLRIFFKSGLCFKGAHWALKALVPAKELLKERTYDYVLTKDGASVIVGYILKKKYGVRWVATWNDPYPAIKYPKPYGKGKDAKCGILDKKLIRVIRKYVDVHIIPNERLAKYMQSYLKVPNESICIIPHVVLDNKIIVKNVSNNKKLRIIHSGNLNYPRNPRTFLKALKVLISQNKMPSWEIEFSILGVLSHDCWDVINAWHLGDYVKILPPVSYEESLQILSDYDLALIIEASCDEGIFLPTKVSDYMQSGISVLAVSPKVGVLNDLYRNKYIPYFADVNDVDAIFKELENVFIDFKNDAIKPINVVTSYTEQSVVRLYKEI